MVNNAFYFILKALFVLKSVNICLDFLAIHKNSLIRKIRLFQNLDVTNSEANNYNTNISRTRGIQTIKFDQFVEYNMRNNFLEKSCTKYGGKTAILGKIFGTK